MSTKALPAPSGLVRQGSPVRLLKLALVTLALVFFIRSLIFRSYRVPSESMVPVLLEGDYLLALPSAYGIRLFGSQDYSLGWRLPAPGDVAVFQLDRTRREKMFPGVPALELAELFSSPYVKRIVAGPGDAVEVKAFHTFVNGAAVAQDDFAESSLREVMKAMVKGAVTSEEAPLASGEADHIPGNDVLLRAENRPIFLLARDEYFMLGDNRVNSFDSRFFGPVKRNEIVGPVAWIFWSMLHNDDGWSFRWNRIGNTP